MNIVSRVPEAEIDQLLDQASAINKRYHAIDVQIYHLKQDQEWLDRRMKVIQDQISTLQKEIEQ